MTVEHLDAKRVQGNYVAGDTGTSQSYRMNGAVGDFVGVNETEGSWTWTAPTGDRGGYESSYASDVLTWDIGSALDDDDWVIRFELDFTTYDPNTCSSAMNGYAIWIADNATATNDTSCDWASIMGYLAQGGSFTNHIGNRMRTSAKPETGFSNGSADCTLTSISATTYYCEAKRNGTSLTLSMTTNSDYTTSADTNTISGDDATGLRYLKSCSFQEYRSGCDPNETVSGTVKNLKICNGTGTFSDGAVTYTLADKIKTIDDKTTLLNTRSTTTTNDWTAMDTAYINWYGGKLHIDSKVDGTRDNLYYTHSGNFSTTWVLRWKQYWTTQTEASGGDRTLKIGIASAGDESGDADASNQVTSLHNLNSSKNQWQLQGKGATQAINNLTGDFASDKTWYCELIKTSASEATFTIRDTSYTNSTIKNNQAITGMSGIADQDTIFIANRDTTLTSTSADISYVTDMEFYDNTTTASGTPTLSFDFVNKTQENTIFNETDTHSQWWLQDGKWKGRNQPNEISDLWAWWKAESQYMSLNGSGVTTWNPQTNATTYQIKADSSSEEPTFEANGRNGRGIVKFDGSEWLHTTDDSNSITQPISFVMIMKFPTGASKTIFDVDNTGGGRVLCRSTSTTGQFELLNGGTVNSATVSALDGSTWGYMVIVLNGASSKWRINGGNEVTINVSDNFRPLTIGADYGGNNDMTGDVMHFIIYNKALSSSEITDIEEWCANEAGL